LYLHGFGIGRYGGGGLTGQVLMPEVDAARTAEFRFYEELNDFLPAIAAL
jgi:hypothetical protein